MHEPAIATHAAIGCTPSTRRRRLLALGATLGLGAPFVHAQPAPQRIAFLSGATSADAMPFFASYVEGLRELGHREGENLVIDRRFADYSADKANRLADEIAASRPACVVASGGGIVPAFAHAAVVPLVFIHSGDPVIAGFAESFARPGRQATGVSLLALDLIDKRLELLKQAQPRMRRVAFLASPEHAGQQRELAASQAAAARFGVEMIYREARDPAELAGALASVAAERPDAALLFSDALMVGQRQPMAEFFLKHRIPSAAGWIAFPQAGHLLSYGPERHAAWRRLASYVDRILKGARAGDLPIELPTVIELAINRRTASTMGLALPPSLMARVDRMIE